MSTDSINAATVSSGVSIPTRILQSMLARLSEGKISDVVEQFDDHFIFKDHALGLEFTDKERLTEFFQKSRDLFPDTVVEVVFSSEYGDRAFAEWSLTATQTVPHGSIELRIPVSARGTSVVRIHNGRITNWSDYYDQNASRRVSLAAFFTEWSEY